MISLKTMERVAVKSSRPRRQRLHLFAHPTINRLEQLWTGHQRWSANRKHYKNKLRRAGDAEAKETIAAQKDFWRWWHDTIGAALATLSWMTTRTLPGSSSYE